MRVVLCTWGVEVLLPVGNLIHGRLPWVLGAARGEEAGRSPHLLPGTQAARSTQAS